MFFRNIICHIFTLAVFTLAGCAQVPSIHQSLQEAHINSQPGRLAKNMTTALVAQFDYNEGDGKIDIKNIQWLAVKVVKSWDKEAAPTLDEIRNLYRKNAESYKENKTLTDYIVINTDGSYRAPNVTLDGNKSIYRENEEFSVFHEYSVGKKNALGTIIVAPIGLLLSALGETPRDYKRNISQERVNMIGAVVETKIMKILDDKLAGLQTVDQKVAFGTTNKSYIPAANASQEAIASLKTPAQKLAFAEKFPTHPDAKQKRQEAEAEQKKIAEEKQRLADEQKRIAEEQRKIAEEQRKAAAARAAKAQKERNALLE